MSRSPDGRARPPERDPGSGRRESCLSRRERARWRPVRPAVLAARSASRLESGLPAWPAVQTPGASRGRCSEEADASAPSRSGRPEGRLAGIRIASRHRQAPPGCRLVPGAAVGAAGSGQKRPEVSRSAPDRPVTAWNSASPRPPSARQWPGSAGAWRSRRPGGGGPGAAARGGSGAVSDGGARRPPTRPPRGTRGGGTPGNGATAPRAGGRSPSPNGLRFPEQFQAYRKAEQEVRGDLGVPPHRTSAWGIRDGGRASAGSSLSTSVHGRREASSCCTYV